jgi:hypothetical protein
MQFGPSKKSSVNPVSSLEIVSQVSYSVHIYTNALAIQFDERRVRAHQRLIKSSSRTTTEWPFRPTILELGGLNGQYSTTFVTSIGDQAPNFRDGSQIEERTK